MKYGFLLGCMATWIFSDAVYSIVLYLNADSYNGKKQTWRRDHYIRVIRGILAIAIIIIGYQL